MAASPNTLNATDANFNSEILKGTGLSLIDFWAEWCGPCKQLGPKIDEIATEFSGKMKVYKMNVDENPETPGQYRVMAIPTVLFFKNGQIVDQLVGNQPKDAIVQTIQKHL